jgi:putative ABC transport system permease protein
MPDRRAPSSARLLAVRSRARAGLLASAAATTAVAVTTVCLVLAWLQRAVAEAGDPPPPGVPAEEVEAQIASGSAALASAAPALVLLVALLAGTAVAQLAGLVAAAREHETATIRARGFSRPQAWVADAVEAVAVTLLGAVAGVALALALAGLVGAAASDVIAQGLWVLAMALLLAAVFAVALRRGERRVSTRGGRATTAALVVIVLLASALVIWQLPLARGAGFDPIVAVAPAVVLMAGAIAGLAVFGAAAVAWATPAATARGLEPGYPARQVARRIPIYAVAVLLVALTVAQAVFTSAYGATWTAMVTDSAAVRAGADLRVDTAPQSVEPGDVAAANAVEGTDAAAAALVSPIEIGSTEAQLVAVPAEMIDPVVTSAGGLIDKQALERAATPQGDEVVAEPIPLGEAATGLRVAVDLQSGSAGVGAVTLVALLIDGLGTPVDVALDGDVQVGDSEGSATLVAEAPLPEGTAPWHLLALAAGTGPSIASSQLTVTITEVEALGEGPIDAGGEASLEGGNRDAVLWLGDGGVLADAAAIEEPDLPPVGAVVSSALATRLGIGVGDPLEFRYAGTGREGEAIVSAVADAVPGASSSLSLFVPMAALTTSQLQRGTSIVPPGSVWASGETSADDALSAALGGRPVATAAPGLAAGVVGALVPGWWIATAGSAVLSLIAAFAIVQTLAIARRRELGVLRALGVAARRQARMRAAELGGVFGAAIVLGAGAGALVSLLIVPELVRAVTPGILALAGGVSIAWPPLAIALAALVAGLAVIVLAAAAGVGRAARGDRRGGVPMTRRVSTRALVAHHLRSRAGGGAIVAALVLMLSLLATAAPLALGVLEDNALRDRLDGLSAAERDVVSTSVGLPQIGETGSPLTTEGVWGGFLRALEGIRDSADEPLPEVLDESYAISRTAASDLLEARRTRELSVAFAPRFDRQIAIVEGRLPDPAPGIDDWSSVERSTATVEIVLSSASAADMEWPVGEVRSLQVYSNVVQFDLVGTFEAQNPSADYWQHVVSVLEPSIFDDGNQPRVVTATAFAHPASLPYAYFFSTAQTTQSWYPVDTGRIEADTAAQTAAALNSLTAITHTVATAAGGFTSILGVKFDAEITGEIELALAQEASTAGVIAMLISGPVGVAAAVLLLGCRLILENRRPSLRLLSARGTSIAQLRGLLGSEGVFVGALPALVGAAVAAVGTALILGAVPGAVGLIPAVLLALTPIAILAVLAPSAAERPARTDLGRRGSRVRLIAEGVVVGVAVLALVLLSVRGYSAGVDPLLAATPLLLALVACLLTLRLYPIPLRAMFGRARASDGLDSFLGSARALRERSIGLTPVLALVVGVSVAVSSGILLSALQTGITDASRAQIGSDVRVTGATFTQEQLDRVAAIDAVAAVAGVSGADPETLELGGAQRGTSVFVVDAADLSAAQGDGPGMLPPGVSLQGADGRMPIVVSGAAADLIDGSDDLRLGGVDAEVVGVTRGPVPVGARENWIALDSSYAEEVLGRDPADRTLLVRLDDGGSLAQVEPELHAILGDNVRIETADQIAASTEAGPAVQAVRWALLAATAVAALLSALAIVMTLTLAAGPRARVLALLRTLGAPRRSATSLALWEIGPPAVAAVIAGTLFGALVPLVVLAAVDLRPFTGSSVAPAYQIDGGVLALTLGGFLALAVLLTAIALLVSRRIRAAGALRSVEEG